MSVFAVLRDSRVDASAIVAHAQRQICAVASARYPAAWPRSGAGVADRFIADAIDLVARDRMHLAAHRRQRRTETSMAPCTQSSVARCSASARSFRSRGRRPKGVQRGAPFLHGLAQPLATGAPSLDASRAGSVGRHQRVVGDHLAAPGSSAGACRGARGPGACVRSDARRSGRASAVGDLSHAQTVDRTRQPKNARRRIGESGTRWSGTTPARR